MEQSEKHFYMIIVSGQTTSLFFFLTGSGTPEQAIGGLNP
jgi:hypothetical protein